MGCGASKQQQPSSNNDLVKPTGSQPQNVIQMQTTNIAPADTVKCTCGSVLGFPPGAASMTCPMCHALLSRAVEVVKQMCLKCNQVVSFPGDAEIILCPKCGAPVHHYRDRSRNPNLEQPAGVPIFF